MHVQLSRNQYDGKVFWIITSNMDKSYSDVQPTFSSNCKLVEPDIFRRRLPHFFDAPMGKKFPIIKDGLHEDQHKEHIETSRLTYCARPF